VNHLVLSGTATVVPSGTRSSCYRGPESKLTPWRSIPSSPRNLPNLESFGFLLTDHRSWRAVNSAPTATPRASCRRSLSPASRRQAVVADGPRARSWPRDPDLISPMRVGFGLTEIPFNQTQEDDVTDLTTVELLWLEKRIENRIRFGRTVAERIIDRRRRILSFAPGTVFAFVRWASNDFGTIMSRVDIMRAATPGQRYSTVPWVTPGGDILLRLTGWPKVERVLQLIDAVEVLDIHPADVALDYWHHIHNRLSVNETPRPYTRGRHQAWLRRRRIAP
jgi:hypothetical protein